MEKNLKFKLRFLTLLLSAFLIISCEEDSEGELVEGPCAQGYQGPTGDIQSDAFCQAAWDLRCNGKDSQADANCAIYQQLQEDNPGIPDCPYCP